MPTFTPFDEISMEQALHAAQQARGLASPNPTVGCVLARGDEFLSEGVHRYDDRDHAEIVALKRLAARSQNARGATAYVTLEPCAHHGRTGPCADALIAAGIRRCVVATVDPNPQVAGAGIARMRAAGIQVDLGLDQAKARALNQAFAFSITHQRPFVTLKAALSVDGYLAPPPAARAANQPFWLTSESARQEVQQLRHESDAILTGIGTVLADDPLLTDRTSLARRRPLLRVLLDTHLRLPLTAKLLHPIQDDLWIFCSPETPTERIAPLTALGARITQVAVTPDGLDLPAILHHLHEAKLLSVLLEAGSALNGAFLHQQLVDRVILYYAETELGPGSLPFAAGIGSPFALEEQLTQIQKTTIGPDVRVTGLLHDPWQNLLAEAVPEIS